MCEIRVGPTPEHAPRVGVGFKPRRFDSGGCLGPPDERDLAEIVELQCRHRHLRAWTEWETIPWPDDGELVQLPTGVTEVRIQLRRTPKRKLTELLREISMSRER